MPVMYGDRHSLAENSACINAAVRNRNNIKGHINGKTTKTVLVY